MTVLLVAAGCTALTAVTAGAVYLFLGHYWHRVFTEKAGRPTYCNRCGIPHREGKCRR